MGQAIFQRRCISTELFQANRRERLERIHLELSKISPYNFDAIADFLLDDGFGTRQPKDGKQFTTFFVQCMTTLRVAKQLSIVALTLTKVCALLISLAMDETCLVCSQRWKLVHPKLGDIVSEDFQLIAEYLSTGDHGCVAALWPSSVVGLMFGHQSQLLLRRDRYDS